VGRVVHSIVGILIEDIQDRDQHGLPQLFIGLLSEKLTLMVDLFILFFLEAFLVELELLIHESRDDVGFQRGDDAAL
jgi:hypothetical protein